MHLTTLHFTMTINHVRPPLKELHCYMITGLTMGVIYNVTMLKTWLFIEVLIVLISYSIHVLNFY